MVNGYVIKVTTEGRSEKSSTLILSIC